MRVRKRRRRSFPHSFLNKIVKDDCLQAMYDLPDESVDLVITSPPYNIKNSSGNGMKDGRGGKWSNAALIHGYSTHDDCMPHDQYVDWQRKCLSEMVRIIKTTGAIFYNHKWRVQNGLLQDRQDIIAGFPLRQVIIWRRKGGINFNPGYFLPTFEVIYLIAKRDFQLLPKANALGDVWDIQQEFQNPHPAPFPMELTDRIIQSCSGSIVMDPFVGSGTTAISALKHDWDFIGVDLADEYCQMARKRIRQFKKSHDCDQIVRKKTG